VGVMAM